MRGGTVNAYRQIERFQSEKKTYANRQMLPKMIRKNCAISAEGEKLLENAITRLGLSARAHDRILKVADTIADLDGAQISRRAISAKPSSTERRIAPPGLETRLRHLSARASQVAVLPYRAS